MKSLHVPFTFFPDPVGGTEVYVAALAAALEHQGHPAVIAAPGEHDAAYAHDGLAVHRFGVGEYADISELYGSGDRAAASAFGAILDDELPDVVHLHAWTRACSIELVHAAHRRSVPVVFTYHTPTVTCQRGTLMEWGRTPCDGVLEVRRCTACALHAHGVAAPLARVLALTPPAVGRRIGAAQRSGGTWTALRFSALVSDRQRAARTLLGEVDEIVALSDWTVRLLVANGVPADKIVQSRHGLRRQPVSHAAARRAHDGLLVAFLGRFDQTKGLDTLVRAFDRIPADANVRLHVYGTAQGSTGALESDALQQLARRDARIEFRPVLSPERVVETLGQYDLLAVPSRWLETGPLVVLEAFAAGVPVLGSALGGIAELVKDGVNGQVIDDYESPDAWAAALVDLAGSPASLEMLRAGIRPPKSMDIVAREMLETYDIALARLGRAARHGHMEDGYARARAL